MRLQFLAVFLLSVTPLLQGAERIPWTSSRVIGSPDPPKPFHVERVYPSLKFNQPVELTTVPGTHKMMLLEVAGKLHVFDDDPEVTTSELVIDLNPLIDDFRRAYGFGLHPDFETNRQLFVAYAGNPVGRPDGSRLSRFVVSREEPFRVDPASEEILLTWPSGGHNGSTIRFDSKGLLYFSAGDGARPYPPDEYDVSQDLSDLRSSICRIDVDHPSDGKLYSIPDDNPFLDVPGARGEIWAYGFRNPWRFTVAPETDQILCGDVGWELWELVFDVQRGGNYGWSIFEGPQPIRSDIEQGPTPIQKPLVAYPHAVGQSVTGGIIYRGKEHPELSGAYLYGDYVTGLLWGLRHEATQVTWNPVLAETGLPIITFAESRDREALVVGYDGGIYKLVKNVTVDGSNEFPRRLSQTGLFTDVALLKPSEGVIEYTPIAKSGAEDVDSRFLIGVPGGETIRISRLQRAWNYPEGTVFAKTLSRGSRKIETQLLHFDGINWHPYAYLWNAEQTDASLVEGAGTTTLIEYADADGVMQSQEWHVQNRAQCRACHSRQNGGSVGFSFENLDESQIHELVEWSILDRQAPKQWNLNRMVDPLDEDAPVADRARSFLAANCAHCHRRGGGGTVPTDLAYSTPVKEMNAIGVAPTQGDFGIVNASVIVPGDPSRSTLYYRMMTSGSGHMPKLGRGDNHALGLKLVHDWISSLSADPALGASLSKTEGASDTSDALREVSRLLLNSEITDRERLETARERMKSDPPLTSALFERFLPREERRKRLGDSIDVEAVMASRGDGNRGRERFMNNQSMQCLLCHRVQGSGQSVGPDLDAIGAKRSRRELLESILLPSKLIDPKFGSHQVLTSDGRVLTGLLVMDTNEQVVIRMADGKNHTIEKGDIETRRIQSESLMPSGLAANMTSEELCDLLAFLTSLK
ncbi:MAG: PQQ-dependent sugar dehydrogenase [Rubripirellula sp.]